MYDVVAYLPCAGPGCSKAVPQRQGRRRRATCSAACRQRLCQQRKRQQTQTAWRTRWQGWPEPLPACLEAILERGGPALAGQTAAAIAAVCRCQNSTPPHTVDELVRNPPARPSREELCGE